MIIDLTGEIGPKMFRALVGAYNEAAKAEESMIIYLDSRGGEVGATNAMLDLIDKYDKATLLVGYGELMSCAFRLFFEAKCERQLLKSTVGMYHVPRWEAYVMANGKGIDPLEDFKFKYLPSELDKAKAFAKSLGWSNQMIKKLVDGEDIFFLPDEMQQMFDRQISKDDIQRRSTSVSKGRNR